MKTLFSTGLFCLILASGVQAQNNTFPATGNVGIGVINPSYKLEVNGRVRAGNYQTPGQAGGAADVNSYSMEVGGLNPTQTNGQATILLHHHNAIAHQLRYTSGTLFLEAAGNGIYGTNNTANLMVGGNVGIGTTDTKGYKLGVNGSAIATSMTVKLNANWPDFVFAKTYGLRPLAEVESYIKAHSHLPEVPSAAQVAKDGINLGEMDATLLKKIEELTLYLIEQNKKIEEQSKQLLELKNENAQMKQTVNSLKN